MKRMLMSVIFAALTASAVSADALPSFPISAPYHSVRQTLLRQGWLPWRLPNARACPRVMIGAVVGLRCSSAKKVVPLHAFSHGREATALSTLLPAAKGRARA